MSKDILSIVIEYNFNVLRKYRIKTVVSFRYITTSPTMHFSSIAITHVNGAKAPQNMRSRRMPVFSLFNKQRLNTIISALRGIFDFIQPGY